ncbi:MAG: hypothetical protein AB7U35_10520 [Sphingobium sp.]
MPRCKHTAIPPAPRKTLLEWIEHDDGNTTGITPPACSNRDKALHARILLDPRDSKNEAREPIPPPSSLRLAPLG